MGGTSSSVPAKLSFTYNGLDASKGIKPAHPDARYKGADQILTLQFRNSIYQMVDKLESFGTELKSISETIMPINCRLVYTTFQGITGIHFQHLSLPNHY